MIINRVWSFETIGRGKIWRNCRAYGNTLKALLFDSTVFSWGQWNRVLKELLHRSCILLDSRADGGIVLTKFASNTNTLTNTSVLESHVSSRISHETKKTFQKVDRVRSWWETNWIQLRWLEFSNWLYRARYVRMYYYVWKYKTQKYEEIKDDSC